MKPGILLLAPKTTYRFKDFLQAAEKVQASVLVASDRCRNLGHFDNVKEISLAFNKPQQAIEKITHFLKGRHLDAIIPVDDNAVSLAAFLAHAYGLAANPLSSTRICKNKFLFRQKLAQTSLPAPRYGLIPLLQRHPVCPPHLSFPVVIKPLLLSGSRGVIRANSPQEFTQACSRIEHILGEREFAVHKTKAWRTLLVEEYIPGKEYAVEGMLTAGTLDILTLFDKPDPLEGPFFEETIYVTPSLLEKSRQDEIRSVLQRACTAIGLTTGPVHAEVRLNDRGIFIIEIAARTIGGLCARLVRYATGCALEEIVVHHALGQPIARPDFKGKAAGVMMIPIPGYGILRSVDGLDAARAVKGVQDIEITAERESLIVPLPEGKSYLGFIFAGGETVKEVDRTLRQAHALLAFDIRAGLPVVEHGG